MEVSEGPPGDAEGGEGAAPRGGMGWEMTAFFLVAQMAGAGFLSLPKGVANSGWMGVVMILTFCVGIGFSGTKLGECWVILEERWPERFLGGSRQPYMDIAEKSLGRPGRIVALASVVITLLGGSTVFLILMASFMNELIGSVSVCAWVLVMAAVVMPFTWLGTPKDFWQASVIAVVSTAIACFVIFIELMMEIPEDFPPEYRNPTVFSFALGFGAILFAFGGASVFPTIQNDMADRSQFSSSIVFAFGGLMIMYLPVAIGGYVVKGYDVAGNILLGVDTTRWWIKGAIVMEILNLMGTYIISCNPVSQVFEDQLGIEKKFSWRRCALRSCIVLGEVVVGLAVPSFDKILNLIGGSTVTICSFLLPGIMYLRLCDMKGNWPKRVVPLWERTALILIVCVGVIGGIVSTATAIWDILDPDSMGKSCFVEFNPE